MLRNWFALKERCPRCDLRFERGEREDYWLGAYAINLVIAEGLSAIAALLVLRATWPETTPALIVGVVMAITMPMLFFPFSRTLWIAWDLGFRPEDEEAGDR